MHHPWIMKLQHYKNIVENFYLLKWRKKTLFMSMFLAKRAQFIKEILVSHDADQDF